MIPSNPANARALNTTTAQDTNGRVWEMEQVTCPLCGEECSLPRHRWRSPYPSIPMDFEIAECTSCGFLFTNPRLSPKALTEYYSDQGPYSGAEYHAPEQMQGRYDDFLDALAEAGLRRGRLLEIGCDKGQFLQSARARGLHVEGVEPSPSATIAREQAGLDVLHGTFEEADYPPEHFDSVVLLDVLEHLSQPMECLHKVESVLRPGGLLLTKVPNVRHEHGIYTRVRKGALGFGVHEHLSHFSQKTLAFAMNRAGLEVVAWRGFLPLDVQSAQARAVWAVVVAAASTLARVWRSWPDYHVALVCISRKPE